MRRRLIINADDLGYPHGTVQSTMALHVAGIVTSTSALTNQPCWPEGAAYLRTHPDLGAGVHLVMNAGSPILPPLEVPSLVDNEGHFRDGMALLRRYGRLRTTELKAEWRAQIDVFIVEVGRPPDHLDLHCQYPYVFPAWFRASLELAQEYGLIPIRMPFDDALDQKAPRMAADNGVPVWYVRWQGRRYQKMVKRNGLKRPSYFEMAFSEDGNRTTGYLLSLLDALPEGTTELLAHPGTEGWRKADARALVHPEVRRRIDELGIELVAFCDLAE